jgi:hypothetical protein
MYTQYVFVLRGMYKNYKYCPGIFWFNSVCVCVLCVCVCVVCVCVCVCVLCVYVGMCIRSKGQTLPVRVEDMKKILFVKL